MTNVAILGFGTVGSGVYEVIKGNRSGISRKAGQDIKVKHILDIRDFKAHEDESLFTKDFDTILNDDEVSVVAELIGGIEPAYSYTKSALMKGKNVVTSNKELVATHGAELLKIARDNNVSYLFEASVGGGIPIIRPLNQCLAANEIYEIMGILNGTTNYILTKMINTGSSFDETLKEAQDKGYAERNPAADIEGHDTCRKIAILSSLVFGKQIDYRLINTEGIVNIDSADVAYADAMGAVIKLIGYSKIENGKVFARVSPMLLDKEHPLANVEDVFNAILVFGDAIGEVMFYGKGAGKMPTASAVVADIINISRNISENGRIMWNSGDESLVINIKDTKTKSIIRVLNTDADKVLSLFPSAKSVDGGIENEKAYIIPEVLESELSEKIKNLGGFIKMIRIA